MDPLIGAALIAGGSSLLGSAMNYNSQADTNQQSIDLWREQAQWNKPVNQVLRWREAGLNPNLVYGQGTSGNIQNLPKQEAPMLDLDFVRSFEMVRNMQAQNENLREQNNNLKAQRGRIDEETKGIELDNRRKKILLGLEEDIGMPHGSSLRDYVVRFLSSLFQEDGQDSAAASAAMQQDTVPLRVKGALPAAGRATGRAFKKYGDKLIREETQYFSPRRY